MAATQAHRRGRPVPARPRAGLRLRKRRAGVGPHDLTSRLGLASKEAEEEHETLFDRDELERVLAEAGLRVEHYGRFLYGMNQLAVASAVA